MRLADSPDAFVARAFVLAADAGSLRRLLPSSEERVARLLEGIRPRRRLFALNLVVKQGPSPALGENVLALREIPPAATGLTTRSSCRSSARRGQGKRAGAGSMADERVVCAAAFVPPTPRRARR